MSKHSVRSLTLTMIMLATLPSYAGQFLQPPSVPGGEGTKAILTGDFNGDGHMDVALANSGKPSVGILLGNGDGTLQPMLEFSNGDGVDYIALGDFDRDGKLDVASVSTLGQKVDIWLGNGDGTLQLPVFSQSTGFNPWSLIAADVNGDGKLDVLTANLAGTISVLLGNGDGTVAADSPVPVNDSPFRLLAGDFNGDGKLDVVFLTERSGSLALILGNGNGTFQPETIVRDNILLNNIDDRYALATADFNGDGKLDFAFIGYGFLIFRGNGDGTFQPVINLLLCGSGLAVGDFNQDGIPDLAVGSTAAYVLSARGTERLARRCISPVW